MFQKSCFILKSSFSFLLPAHTATQVSSGENIPVRQTRAQSRVESRGLPTYEQLKLRFLFSSNLGLIKEERRNSEQYSSFSSPNSSFPHCMIPPALQGGKHLSEKQQQQQTNKPGFKNIPES